MRWQKGLLTHRPKGRKGIFWLKKVALQGGPTCSYRFGGFLRVFGVPGYLILGAQWPLMAVGGLSDSLGHLELLAVAGRVAAN